MANSCNSEFMRCYMIAKKQFEDKNEGILNKSTLSGRMTMRFKEFMALGEITDQALVLSYEALIRKAKNKFNLINLDYSRSARGLLAEFTFDLAVSNDTVASLLKLLGVSVIVEALPPAPLPAHPPAPKKKITVNRKSNKETYTSQYVDKYCFDLVEEIKLLISTRLSGKATLLDLIKVQILQRLEKHLIEKEKDDSMFINTIIVDNIKRGITSMRLLGRNCKEQMHIQEIVAIFTSGSLTIDKQKEFTGLSHVSVEYGIGKRKEYEIIADKEREKLRKAGDSSNSSSSSGSYVNDNEDGEDNEALDIAHNSGNDVGSIAQCSDIDEDENIGDLWGSDSDTDGGGSDADEVNDSKKRNLENISRNDVDDEDEEDNHMYQRPRSSEGMHSVHEKDSISDNNDSDEVEDSDVVEESGVEGLVNNYDTNNASQSVLKKRNRDDSDITSNSNENIDLLRAPKKRRDDTRIEKDNISKKRDANEITPEIELKSKERTLNGAGKRHKINHIFRDIFSSKGTKERSDKVSGMEIQLFCHESPWGGRLDTCKLGTQMVLLKQPLGGFEYEAVRTQQYNVGIMHKKFGDSDFGARLRIENGGNDISKKLFCKLCCKCITQATQRDTSNYPEVQFDNALISWEHGRTKDPNIKMEIHACQKTDCLRHKLGSDTAKLYRDASKSSVQFLEFLLCSPIERSELAIIVGKEGEDNHAIYKAKNEEIRKINIEMAQQRELRRESDFKASCALKGDTKKNVIEKQAKPMLDFSHIAGFSFYQRKCMDGSCEKCGLYNIMMMRSMSRALPELTANGKKKRKKKVVGLPTGAIVLPVSGAAVKKSRKKKGVTVPIPAGVPGIGTVGIEPAGVPGIGTVGIEPAGVPGVRTVGTEPAGVPEIGTVGTEPARVPGIGTVGTEPAGVSGIGPDDARGVVGDEPIAQGVGTAGVERPVNGICDREFNCKDINGESKDIGIEVTTFKEQIRGGGCFQKETEKVIMTQSEFQAHFEETASDYMKHHYLDVMNSQSRRKLYHSVGAKVTGENGQKEIELHDAVIIAMDFSAKMDGHSQDQLNNTIQSHSSQLVILASYLVEGVLTTSAYSFWFQSGTSELTQDNHVIRECVNRVLEDIKSKGIEMNKLYIMTDGSPTQFKNRFMVFFLSMLLRRFNLLFVVLIIPPTATFKGEHDGVGNLDKIFIKENELNETVRCPTTRDMMPHLWARDPMVPTPLHDPKRKLHTIDEHVRVFVVEESDAKASDKADHNFLVTTKATQDYDCSVVEGIFSCHMIIVFQDSTETGETGTDQTVYLRNNFCACNVCRRAEKVEDYELCTYPEDSGPLMKKTMRSKGIKKMPVLEIRLQQYHKYLHKEGPLIDQERIIVRIRGGGLAYLTTLPEILKSKRTTKEGISYKRNTVIVQIDMLMLVPSTQIRTNPTPEGYVDYVKNSKLSGITVLLGNVYLPPIGEPNIVTDVYDLKRKELTLVEVLEERIQGLVVVRILKDYIDVLADQEETLD